MHQHGTAADPISSLGCARHERLSGEGFTATPLCYLEAIYLGRSEEWAWAWHGLRKCLLRALLMSIDSLGWIG